MKFIVTLEANRSEYSATRAADKSITVGEFIKELKQFNEDAKIVFSNDGGYTYGYVCGSCIDIKEIENNDD